MILSTILNDFHVMIKDFINKNTFIRACVFIGTAALIFLLGTKVGGIIHTLT